MAALSRLLDRPVVRYGAVVLVATVILLGSVADPPSGGLAATYLGIPEDKWLHGLAYAGLAGAVAFARRERDARALVVAVAVAAAYGVGIEAVQLAFPARATDPLDALANTVGATAGAACWRPLASVAPWLAHPDPDSAAERTGR